VDNHSKRRKVVMSFDLSSREAWYVLQTKPKKETEACRNLSDQGYQYLFPKILDYRTVNGRFVQTEKPLFPNYLFIQLILSQDYNRVKWTKGIARFVGWGDAPAPIPDEIVETIRRRMDEGSRVKMELDIKPSEEVRIKSGPFKDFIGIFERKMSAQDRIRILLQMAGSQVSVNVPESLVERVR
jgi:transcriptional antiterminator RfaH